MENQPNSGGCGSGCGCHSDPGRDADSTRRNLLKAAGVTLGAAAFAKAISPIVNWSRENLSVDEFLQQHYRELMAFSFERKTPREGLIQRFS